MKREPNEVLKQEGQTLNNQKSTKMRKGRAKKRQVLPDPRYGEKRRINQNEDNDSTETNDLEVEK